MSCLPARGKRGRPIQVGLEERTCLWRVVSALIRTKGFGHARRAQGWNDRVDGGGGTAGTSVLAKMNKDWPDSIDQYIVQIRKTVQETDGHDKVGR